MILTIEKPIGEDLIITIKDKVVIPPVDPPNPQQPFKVHTIPGKILAIDYDLGGEGVAFHDTDAINQGTSTTRPDANDLETNNIGWTGDSDWYVYTIPFKAGTFVPSFEVAAVNAGSSFKVLEDGVQIGVVTVPVTGAWQTYQTVSLPSKAFTAGNKVIRIEAIKGGFNLKSFSFLEPVVVPPVTPPAGNVITVTPSQNFKSITESAPVGTTVKLSAGTHTIAQTYVPAGVFVDAAGKDVTFIKAQSQYYYQNSADFGVDKYLINFRGGSGGGIKNLTIDGDAKKLHGGIYNNGRTNFTLENVKVVSTGFCGIWLNNAANSVLKGFTLLNCSGGQTGWCSGCLQIANSPNVDVSNFDISEDRGYGIKNLGHTNGTPVSGLKIHDGRVSVVGRGIWNDGKAPNITIELWGNSFPGTEIYNCYIDNTLSLVNPTEYAVVRTTPIKIYNNNFDIAGRSGGAGYSIELSINDAEVYNNYFNSGSTALVNWHVKQCMGWNIHHNTFKDISRMINSQCKASKGAGLKDVTITNNTVEMNSGGVGFVELNSSNGDNVKIQKNLFIGTSGTPAIVSCVNGATMVNSVVSDNFFSGSLNTNVSGVTPTNNLTGDPLITKTGVRPTPYYKPLAGSPLLARDIGAFK